MAQVNPCVETVYDQVGPILGFDQVDSFVENVDGQVGPILGFGQVDPFVETVDDQVGLIFKFDQVDPFEESNVFATIMILIKKTTSLKTLFRRKIVSP